MKKQLSQRPRVQAAKQQVLRKGFSLINFKKIILERQLPKNGYIITCTTVIYEAVCRKYKTPCLGGGNNLIMINWVGFRSGLLNEENVF